MLKERFQDPCSVAQMRIAGKIQFFPSQNFFINIAEFYDYEHCMRIRKTYLKTQTLYQRHREVRLSKVKFQFCHLPALETWTDGLAFLSLNFLIFKAGGTIVRTSCSILASHVAQW